MSFSESGSEKLKKKGTYVNFARRLEKEGFSEDEIIIKVERRFNLSRETAEEIIYNYL